MNRWIHLSIYLSILGLRGDICFVWLSRLIGLFTFVRFLSTRLLLRPFRPLWQSFIQFYIRCRQWVNLASYHKCFGDVSCENVEVFSIRTGVDHKSMVVQSIQKARSESMVRIDVCHYYWLGWFGHFFSFQLLKLYGRIGVSCVVKNILKFEDSAHWVWACLNEELQFGKAIHLELLPICDCIQVSLHLLNPRDLSNPFPTREGSNISPEAEYLCNSSASPSSLVAFDLCSLTPSLWAPSWVATI